jgi:hypothetical protein
MNCNFKYTSFTFFIIIFSTFQRLFAESTFFTPWTQRTQLHSTFHNRSKFIDNDHHVFRKLQVQPSSQPTRQPSTQPSSSPTFQTHTFGFTGSAQTFTVPPNVQWIAVDVVGAAGGDSSLSGLSGKGARVQTTLPVTSGSVLSVFVGGQGGYSIVCGGGATNAGWNGGGSGYGCQAGGRAGGGGGASDIRVGAAALTDRTIVAGGGGGTRIGCCCNSLSQGGDAGEEGSSGANGEYCDVNGSHNYVGGGGATKTAGGSAGSNASPGTLGNGGEGSGNNGGGGGGGYYGGIVTT